LPFTIGHCSNPNPEWVYEAAVFTLLNQAKSFQFPVQNGKWKMENEKDEAFFGLRFQPMARSISN